MGRVALGAFERMNDGTWECRRATVVQHPSGWPAIKIRGGMTFSPHTVFAGFDDFTEYLESVAVDGPSIVRDE